MQIENKLYKNSISSYFNQRILRNSNHYFKKDGLKQQFDVSHTDQNLFFLIYFVVGNLLDDGNTVLMLQEHNDVYDYGINKWQISIIQPVIDLIDNELSGLLSFKNIFTQIDNYKTDRENLINFIEIQKDEFNKIYQTSQIINPTKISKFWLDISCLPLR